MKVFKIKDIDGILRGLVTKVNKIKKQIRQIIKLFRQNGVYFRLNKLCFSSGIQ